MIARVTIPYTNPHKITCSFCGKELVRDFSNKNITQPNFKNGWKGEVINHNNIWKIKLSNKKTVVHVPIFSYHTELFLLREKGIKESNIESFQVAIEKLQTEVPFVTYTVEKQTFWQKFLAKIS